MITDGDEAGVASNATDSSGAFKDSEVLLGSRKYRAHALAYYSSALLMKEVIMIDICIAKAIFMYGHIDPVTANEVATRVVGLLDLMKERHVSREFIDERINYFEQHGEIQFKDNMIVPVSKTHKRSSITYFLMQMGFHLFDACKITLLAVKTIFD
jgi:hypothetical protein